MSALSFALGATLPVLVVLLPPLGWRVVATVIVTMMGLGALGAVGARLGGAPVGRAAARVLVGGALALAVSALVGRLVGAAV